MVASKLASTYDGAPRSLRMTPLNAAGSDGIARSVDGGKPLEIDGDMVLCGRSDDTAQRGYTGSLAELAIWNTILTAQQVSAIYTSVSTQS